MAAASILASSTHTESDVRQLGRVYELLTADEATHPVSHHYLVGGSSHDPVELPEDVYRVLLRIVDAMQQGLSVTISPTSQTLTTQQAADLLGISRPTLIKALDNGKLPFTRSGTHRRLALTDVLDYREQRRRDRYAAIEALSVDVNESDDIDEVLGELKSARKAVTTARRGPQHTG